MKCTLCSSLLLILVLGQGANADPAPLQIQETNFFVRLSAPSDGSATTSQEFDTTVVPLVPRRSCYGWRIKVSTDQKLIKFREEFTLPTEPKRWSGENNEFATNKIINKRRTSVTNRFVTPDNGWVENAWCVIKGDPEGDYSMKVYLNDQFIEKFYFKVRKLATRN